MKSKLNIISFSNYRREVFALLVIAIFSFICVLLLHINPRFLAFGALAFVFLVMLINYPFIAILIDLFFVFVLVGLSATLYSGWSYKAFTFICILALFINRMYGAKKIIFGSAVDALLLLGYIVFMLLSSIVNQVSNISNYLLLIIMKYSITFLIINLMDSRKLVIIYFVAFIIIGTINNLVGIMQVILGIDWYGFGPRAIGFLVNPNGMGYLQALLIPFIFIVMAQTSNKKIRFILMILFFICPITAILSQSRGAIIATLLVMAGVLLVSLKNYYVFILITIASILVGIFWQEPYTERLRSTFERSSILEEQRGYLYRAAVVMIVENPVFGVGPGKFGEEFATTYANRVNAPSRHLQVPHNGYLEVMTYSGIPGLIFIMSLIGLWIVRFRRGAKKAKEEGDMNTNQLCMLMIISILGYLVVAMFETLTEVKNFYYFMGINIAVTSILAKEYKQKIKTRPDEKPKLVLKTPYSQVSANT